MKHSWQFWVILLFSVLLSSTTHATPDFPFDLTEPEVRSLDHSHPGINESDPIEVTRAIALGRRLLDWKDLLNLEPWTTIKPRGALQPFKYGPQLIGDRLDTALQEMPAEMRDALVGKGQLVDHLNFSLSDFIKYGQQVFSAYQYAVRWKSVIMPYRSHFKAARFRDIRGYFELSQGSDPKKRIKDYFDLPTNEQNQLKIWLLQICENKRQNTNSCTQEFDSTEKKKRIFEFFQKYMLAAKQNYESFFKVTHSRRGFEGLRVSFKDPAEVDVKSFISKTLESAWQYDSWRLRVEFSLSSKSPLIEVKFESGTTSHANGLGGNLIVLSDYYRDFGKDAHQVLSHEFGHTLGFPDCYLEFLESDDLAVGYYIDPTDIMCARTGAVKKRHYDELERVYFTH